MAKSMQITRFGGPEVFSQIEIPDHPLNADQVRIQVKAAGVNFADLMMRMGMYPEAPKPPFTPGYEVSGTVIEVGSAVHHFKIGDSVFAGCKFGGYTHLLTLQASQIRKIPLGLNFEEAASIPVNFLTAWIALHEMGRVRKGDHVVVPSAAGGVGVAAVQLAALAGARVTGLVSTHSKDDFVRELGAQDVLTYAEWEKAGPGDLPAVDILLDSMGGKSLKKGLLKLSPTGRLISYGVSSAIQGQKRSLWRGILLLLTTPWLIPFQMMNQNVGFYGLNVLKLFDDAVLQKALDQLIELFDQKKLRTVVGKTFPIHEAGQAHEYLMSRKNLGKVILTVH